MNTLELIILALAVWRLSSLFANESGPFHIFKRIRDYTQCHIPGFYEGLECEWCNSVWFGTALTILYYFFRTTLVWCVLPLALSAVVVILKYTLHRIQSY